MSRGVVALVAGALFGTGLVVSGMGQPSKIIGFLDFTGNWDPSVAFMFIGTVPLYAAVYRYSQRKAAPLLGGQFPNLPKLRVDGRLLMAAVIFGIGWGLGGYCPGSNNQGYGWEYIDTNSAWHPTATLKPGNPGYNAQAAADTHIQL